MENVTWKSETRPMAQTTARPANPIDAVNSALGLAEDVSARVERLVERLCGTRAAGNTGRVENKPRDGLLLELAARSEQVTQRLLAATDALQHLEDTIG